MLPSVQVFFSSYSSAGFTLFSYAVINGSTTLRKRILLEEKDEVMYCETSPVTGSRDLAWIYTTCEVQPEGGALLATLMSGILGQAHFGLLV